MISVIRFLASASDGRVGVICLEKQMHAIACGALVPLPPSTRTNVDDISILDLICSCSLDPFASFVPYTIRH